MLWQGRGGSLPQLQRRPWQAPGDHAPPPSTIACTPERCESLAEGSATPRTLSRLPSSVLRRDAASVPQRLLTSARCESHTRCDCPAARARGQRTAAFMSRTESGFPEGRGSTCCCQLCTLWYCTHTHSQAPPHYKQRAVWRLSQPPHPSLPVPSALQRERRALHTTVLVQQ